MGPVRAAEPKRVVSLNPCLDAILLAVADRAQILALSRYSSDPSQSAVFALARRFPHTGGSGEELAALRPDLVLNSGMGAAELAHVLPRLRIPEADFRVPDTVDESLDQVTRVARLVGHAERGAALNARIRAALAAAAPPPGSRPLPALIFEHHGFASGPNTLMDDLLRRTGFLNLALRYGMRSSFEASLEQVIADPPQVLLAGRMAPGEPSWADRILSHPALAALAPRVRRESFPETLMFCGGPIMIPAAAALARARRDALMGVSQ
jgi:iron complex transport system substrate-binding protein